MQTRPSTKPLPLTPAGLDPLLLAGTLCARVCHDLSGSLGALTGTLEMAAEDGDREALQLSMVLAQELSARLRLVRAAWGSGADIPALETLLPGLPGVDRLRVDLAGFVTADDEMRRLALNLLVVAAASLPRGGAIHLAGTDISFALEIEGLRAAWPETLRNCLASQHALLEACEAPRAVAVALACLQARTIGREIVLESPTRLILR